MGHELARIRRRRRGRQSTRSAPWKILPAFLLAIAVTSSAVSREPAGEFVKGLQDRGLHDIALEYLQQLKTSPLADDSIRQQIPYLRGVALLEQSRQSTDATARNRLLDEARQELERFTEANPHNVLGAEAQLQLAMVQMSRGQDLVSQVVQLPKGAEYDAQRKTLGHDARVMFAEARDTFGRAESIYSAELAKLPPTTSGEVRGDTSSKRQEYRGRSAQIRFLVAQTQFEEAQSYPADADEFRKLNETAAQDLSTIYDEFGRTMPVGLYARIYEGRCYQAMGSYQLALGCFDQVIGKDNVLPVFRKLTASAVQRKAEVLIAQEKLDAAINACRECLKEARKDELNQAEWLGVRFRLAEAISKKVGSPKAETSEQRKLLAEAREAYRAVARTPGEYQVAARAAAVAVVGGKKSSEKDSQREEPKNFQAACELGKDALASFNTAKTALPSAEKNNPEAVPELQTQMDRSKEDARHYFQVATTLVEYDTDLKALNEVRYYLCWLYWDSKDYYRAAVLGEFLSRRYPDDPTASSSAKLAMASFEQLYSRAVSSSGKRESGDFEARQMAGMAELIIRRWPKTEDADSAFAVLVNNAINNGQIEEAEKQLGEASPQARPRLELKLGNAMWLRYLDLSQPGRTPPADEAALEKIKSSALKYLRKGYDLGRKDSPEKELVTFTALYLAQALLNDDKYEEAIAVLEDDKVGPLKRVADGDPVASRGQFAVDAYKLALRAYVSVIPPQEEKAINTMRALERAVKTSGDPAKSAEQLNRIYIGMGVALQKQIEDLRAAGKEGEAKRVAGAVAKFLDRITAQPGTANWPMRVWLAQAYYSMATEQQPASQQAGSMIPVTAVNKTARDYLTKARDTYQQLLKEAADNPKLPPSDTAALAAKVQLGECYRALGQFDKALDTFWEILKEKEASLDVQRAAAQAYQERGQKEDPKFFESAIHGGYKSPKTNQNVVWGWLKIANVTARATKSNAKFRESSFEARYYISRCRYLAGMKKLGDARRKDLTTAKDSIQTMAQIYPDLGGEKWKPQFEKLLKQIEAAMKDEG
jgi:tetratricopeptide (TPR) repeat protein